MYECLSALHTWAVRAASERDVSVCALTCPAAGTPAACHRTAAVLGPVRSRRNTAGCSSTSSGWLPGTASLELEARAQASEGAEQAAAVEGGGEGAM